MAMQDSNNKQASGSQSSERKKRLILGGRAYTIDDDDISVISPAEEKSKSPEDKQIIPSTGSSNLNNSSDLTRCIAKVQNNEARRDKDVTERYNLCILFKYK